VRLWARRATAAAVVLGVVALASPGYAYPISAARAAAIHECSARAAPFIEHTWGDTEIYIYRACMAEHGQRE
jgi:hypothetical protein